MRALKRFFIKVTVLFVFVAPTLPSHGNFNSLLSDSVNIRTKIVSPEGKIRPAGGIEDGLEHESLKQILALITTLKGGKIGEIVKIFSNNVTNWIWVITEGPLVENVNAKTELISGIATTTLDYGKFQNATNISVAKTIIHEMIHAYLTLYFRYDGINANKEYPGVMFAWLESHEPDYNDIQHQEIEKYFVEDIAKSLKEFGQKVGLVSIKQSVYNDLAWGGLNFENSSLLQEADKQRIQGRLSAEQLNMVFDTQSPVGNKLTNSDL